MQSFILRRRTRYAEVDGIENVALGFLTMRRVIIARVELEVLDDAVYYLMGASDT